MSETSQTSVEPTQLETGFRPITDLKQLPRDERRTLRKIAGHGVKIKAVVYSDLLFSGQYGMSRLVLTENTILVAENGQAERQLPLKKVKSAQCRDYVGNGVFEVRLQSGRRVSLIRYSKTLTDPFQEMAELVNEQLGVSEDDLEAHQDEAAKTSGPKEDTRTYRCHSCGYPLKYATDACPKCTDKKKNVLRLLSLLSEHRRLLAVGLLFGLAVVGVNMAPPMLVRWLVDGVLEPKDDPTLAMRYQRLGMVVALFFLAIAVRAGAQFGMIKAIGKLAAEVVLGLRRSIYRALQRLSLSYYDREHTGRIMSRVLSDTQTVQGFVVNGVQRLVQSGMMVVAIPFIMFVLNWKLALVALIPIPIVVMVGRHFAHRYTTIYRALRRRMANLSATVSESVSGMRVVKSFAQEDREVDTFDGKAGECYDAQLSAASTRARFNPSVTFLMFSGSLVVWLIGGRAVIGGEVTSGTLIAMITLMNMLYNPVQQLLQLTEVYQRSATAAERVFNILDMPPEVSDHDKARDLDHVEGRLRIDNVSFAYESNERVLKNINLDIKPGEMIGLVGQTGSGKSTLVSLICRFYDPTRGTITLDGHDLRDIRKKSLRSHIGMVLQDTFLFAGTVKDNITYGNPDASERAVIEAAKAANAHDFIMNLPDGYDTEVGERGVGLSGGEKQRISIARAILKNPAVLILDEATSAVDTATEMSIQEAMDRLVKGRTTIAIAHRLSTLRNADRLIVMEDGEIIEQGTHQELMERDGEYAHLCKVQANFAEHVEGAGKNKGPSAVA